MMEKTKEEGLVGNDRYEGFCVDLLKDIADEMEFRYTFYLVPDGKYGAPEKSGENGEKENWTGMVRELMDNVSIHVQQSRILFYIPIIILQLFTSEIL